MLAPKQLPMAYEEWNRDHKSPYGANWWRALIESRYLGRFAYPGAPGRLAWARRASLPKWVLRRIGPFGFQANSATRRFEYPWCHQVTPISRGMRVLDIGAGAAGLQFLLSLEGLEVVSVDPMINPSSAVDWILDLKQLLRLNSAFGGRVTFVADYLERAELPAESFDRAFAVSVLEHLTTADCISLVREVERLLKPGGCLVATVDLFLDCHPFADLQRNQYGSNINLHSVIAATGLVLKEGRVGELFGFPEFDASRTASHLDDYLCVNRTLSQCFVLEKR